MAREIDNAKFNKIDCKGRNGYFSFGHTSIWSSGPRPELRPYRVFIQIYSKRLGQSCPLQIDGPIPEIVEFVDELHRKVREVAREIG